MMSGKSTSFTAIMVFFLLILCVITGFLAPSKASAEFYSYEDLNGTIHFVDDLSNIPKEYRKKKQVRKDAYDDFPADERALLLGKEREKQRAAERQRESEQQEQARKRRAEEERQAAEERLTTKVIISDRQVFVPVKLRNGSVETAVMLLLDTGSSSSLITPEVAERLKIMETDKVRVGVVGGRVINARKVVLSHMEVGPIMKTDQEAVIVQQHPAEFGDGLLGMSFLGGLKYTIDFEKQTINWIP